MATPNYTSPIGGLSTNRYDFQSHIEGTAFRHNSNQIDVNPPVDVNGTLYYTVADALNALSTLTSISNILIFNPSGIANSNVYTSWTALMTARATIQGPAVIVVISSTSSPATIDVGTWDLTQNTSIVGNVYGLLQPYFSELIIPNGAQLLNPVSFKDIFITSSSNSPAMDLSASFAAYFVNFDNAFIVTSGSGALLNAKPGNIILSGLTIVSSSTMVQGSLTGTMNFFLNDEARINNNTVNVSSGTVNIYVNSPTVFCGTTQPGATIIGLLGDVQGQPGANFVNSLTGNGSNPIVINTKNLQYAAGLLTPTINQATTSSTSGTTLTIQAQSATGAGNNGGNLVLAGGSSGSSFSGEVQISNGITQNTIFAQYSGLNTIWTTPSSVSATNWFSQVSGTTQILNGATAIQLDIGATANLLLSSGLLQWAAGISSPSLNQALTSSGNGTNFTISAQNSTASSSIGGNLLISGGSGTSGDGYSYVEISGAKRYYPFAGTGSAAKNISNYLVTYDTSGIPSAELVYTISLSNDQVTTIEVTYVGNNIVAPSSSCNGKVVGVFYCSSGSVSQISTTQVIYFVGSSGVIALTPFGNTIQVYITAPNSDTTYWQLDIYANIA
jgi:hypothetical protein